LQVNWFEVIRTREVVVVVVAATEFYRPVATIKPSKTLLKQQPVIKENTEYNPSKDPKPRKPNLNNLCSLSKAFKFFFLPNVKNQVASNLVFH
jgi:hypothetical protein